MQGSVEARRLLTSSQGVDFSRLPLVHITGTKGKGSTAAMTESILRSHGLRTGLFVSPHLIEPTERIRLDGRPLSKELFTHVRLPATLWRV